MMEGPETKNRLRIITIAVVFAAAVPFIMISALSGKSDEIGGQVIKAPDLNFDYDSAGTFIIHDRLVNDYMTGASTERTLEMYYSLRQYPGSPPWISHRIDDEKISNVNCLSCHERGGWSEELKGNTPVTPHPEQVNCIQCHVKPEDVTLFMENDWVSLSPPLLGRSYLPGSPVPIPHDLQGRGNCIACHVGPGAVEALRTDHPERGSCRQCHVPDIPMVKFRRDE